MNTWFMEYLMLSKYFFDGAFVFKFTFYAILTFIYFDWITFWCLYSFFFVMNTYKGWRFCYSLIPKISNTLWGTAILTVVLTSTGWVFFFQLRSYQIVVVGVNHCVLHFYIYIFVVSQYRPCQRQNVAVFVLK